VGRIEVIYFSHAVKSLPRRGEEPRAVSTINRGRREVESSREIVGKQAALFWLFPLKGDQKEVLSLKMGGFVPPNSHH